MKEDRVGEENINSFGSKITIIEYINAHKVKIQFDNGYVGYTEYGHFKDGKTRSPYCKTVYGIGYIGEGIHKVTSEGKGVKKYRVWQDMLKRCYDEKYHNRKPTYKNCSVCEEWLCYQNFAKWYDENYYEVNNEIMCLDKDILHKGNKIYSQENCVFVPNKINVLFTKSDGARGKYPIGMTKDDNKFVVNCGYYDFENNKKEHKYLGRYETTESAFNMYRKFKEEVIKHVADYFKYQIPLKLYEAMYRYKVEITD